MTLRDHIMSLQEETAGTPSPEELFRLARKQLLDEFEFSEKTCDLLENQLGQEPYNMITNRDGSRIPSTRWSTTVEKLWAWNNAVPDDRGRQQFAPTITVKGQTFERRSIIMESGFSRDLHHLLREQFRDLGYARCFTKEIQRRDRGQEYTTMLVQVPV